MWARKKENQRMSTTLVGLNRMKHVAAAQFLPNLAVFSFALAWALSPRQLNRSLVQSPVALKTDNTHWSPRPPSRLQTSTPTSHAQLAPVVMESTLSHPNAKCGAQLHVLVRRNGWYRRCIKHDGGFGLGQSGRYAAVCADLVIEPANGLLHL